MERHDKGRMGEIALEVLSYVVGQEGLKLNSSFRRKLGHMAKETGVPLKELTEFSEFFIARLVDKHVRHQSKRSNE